MKKTIIFIIIVCAQQTLLSMDPTNKPSQESIIQQIYYDIYKEYGSNPAHNDLYGLANIITQWTLNTKECLDIINIVEKNCTCNTEIDLPDTFNKLYSQNSFFKSAIDELTRFATYNLKFITVNNITTIENPEKQQPTLLLNELPLSIKKYVMNRALEQINYPQEIVLSGEHQDAIHAFDICELTDQAVTSSFKRKPTTIEEVVNFTWPNDKPHDWNTLFLLWNLKTGKVIKNFDESSPINLLAFNPNGSCIAAAMYNENTVKIWCPKTGNLLHNLACKYKIQFLHYSHPTPSILTATSKYKDSEYDKFITQWVLSCDHKAGELLNESYVGDWRTHNYFNGKKYVVDRRIPSFMRNNELHITKKNCISLSLCMKAIKNIKPIALITHRSIESSASYLQLTDLEQRIVHTAIQQKSGKSQDKKLELKTLTQ